MRPSRIVDDQAGGGSLQNAMPKRGSLSAELHAHRFSTVLAPISVHSPTPPLFRDTTTFVRPNFGQLSSLNTGTKISTSSSNVNGTSSGENSAVGAAAGTNLVNHAFEKHGALLQRPESYRFATVIADGPMLSAPPLRVNPLTTSLENGPREVTSTATAAAACATPPLRLTSRPPVPAEVDSKPRLSFGTPSPDEDTQTAAHNVLGTASQQGRRITFVLHQNGVAANNLPSDASAPVARACFDLMAYPQRPVQSLHSEMGMFQLEYLDEGGKLQRRLSAYYHFCPDRVSPAGNEAELMFADHLGPFLRESRQFRDFVVDDIDRSCGVVNTAVTGGAKDDEDAPTVRSTPSDVGTETTTLSGTVTNALKSSVGPATSELRESYQPLQGVVFENALRTAWEWKQGSTVASGTLQEAIVSDDSLLRSGAEGRLPMSLSPTLASTILTDMSQAASAVLGRTPTGGSDIRAAVLNNSGFSNSSLPTFKAEVKAALQLDYINDPRAPLTPLQLLACKVCVAELISRKAIWTSFLAERYELHAVRMGMETSFDEMGILIPKTSSIERVLAYDSALVQSYFQHTLEEFLPWMADLYLQEYKATPSTKAQFQAQATRGALAGGGTSIGSRKFSSVVRDGMPDTCPLPLMSQRPGLFGLFGNTAKKASPYGFLRGGPAGLSSSTFSPDTIIFTVSFRLKFSFIILEEFAVMPHMLLPGVVADTMHMLMPSATSAAPRDSMCTSSTYSVSLPVVADSFNTSPEHDKGPTPDAPYAAPFSSATAEAVAAPGSGRCNTPHAPACRDMDPSSLLKPAIHRSQQQQQQQHDRTGDGTVAPTATATPTTVSASRASTQRQKIPSPYDTCRVLLKILFKFYRDEAAYNFLNDSPISMRYFFPFPNVSWERVAQRSRSFLVFDAYYKHMNAAANSHWGFKSKVKSSKRRNGKQWSQQHWDRVLRHCEQEALNTSAALRELWYMAREWWLQYVQGTFQSLMPVARSVTDSTSRKRLSVTNTVTAPTTTLTTATASGARGSAKMLSSATPALPKLASGVSRTPHFPGTAPAITPSSGVVNSVTAGDVGVSGEASNLCDAPPGRVFGSAMREFMRQPPDHDVSCGSPPSVSSSEMIMGSLVTSLSKPVDDSLAAPPPLLLPTGQTGGESHATLIRPALQKLAGNDAPQQLQGSTSTFQDSSNYSLSVPSIMSSVSQPGAMLRKRLSQDKSHDGAAVAARVSLPPLLLSNLEAGPAASPAALPCAEPVRATHTSSSAPSQHPQQRQPVALIQLHGSLVGDFVFDNSRLMVPPMITTMNAFYKGRHANWDLVLLMRSQALTRAIMVEQQQYERHTLELRERRSMSAMLVCDEMEECMKAEEDVWLKVRRDAAKHLWDQVFMEKSLFACKWAQEQAQLDFVSHAVTSHVSLAELHVEAMTRLIEDFEALVTQTGTWEPPATPSSEGKLITAAFALCPSRSHSDTGDGAHGPTKPMPHRKDHSRNEENADEERVHSGSVVQSAHVSSEKPFNFWGYGYSLPPPHSAVGFNDGLVIMSRLCRDMHVRGKRLRTHWFTDDGDDMHALPTRDFHELEYANHDTYVGFTRIKFLDESEDEVELEFGETHTPRGRTDSMTDIHREGEDGAGQLQRHGLGNYTCKSLGYTYVGGWSRDRPHGDGALLFNGVLPWEVNSEAPKKSLLLLFGRWEHGKLVQLELFFSGVPLINSLGTE